MDYRRKPPSCHPPFCEIVGEKTDSTSAGYLQPYAQVEWDSAGAPRSPEYGDIYWNPDQGVEEKRHVFLAANKLRERWKERKVSFSILELGFGFGLNCLLSAQLWQTCQTKPGTILNFISIEKHPVDVRSLKKLYATLEDEQLKTLASELIDAYPEATRGTHLIWLSDNICLTLVLGADVTALKELQHRVDAIFLDGFSPGKNARMWNAELLARLSTLSHSGTTLSSYSVSGALRRGLSSHGFIITKKQGFGRKHEMLTARFQAPTHDIGTTPLSSHKQNPSPKENQTVIVGAGIAGLACAKSLLKRGHKVQVVEQGAHPISGASAINQLAVYPHISVRPDPLSIFSLSAFQYALRERHANRCEYEKIAKNAEEADRLKRVSDYFPDCFISYEQEEGLGYLVFKSAAWLNVLEAYHETLQQIDLLTNTEVSGIEQSEHGWSLHNPQGAKITEAANVIFATGYSTLSVLQPLELNTNRGQAISVRTEQFQSNAISSSNSNTLFPENHDGTRIFSGTNSRESISLLPDANDTQKLMAALQETIGTSFEMADEQVGIRCTTRDRIPIVGGLPDWPALIQFCLENRRRKITSEFNGYEKGLYVCTGFGAHGATHAPASGEYLARLICHEPTPTSWHGLLDPARFKIRDRNKQDRQTS